MDRFDERKPNHSPGEDETREEQQAPEDRKDRDEPVRQGDILGLGGAAVPKEPGDPTTEYDAESIARRRERAGEGESGLADANDDLPPSRVGTGIGRPELDRNK